MDGTMVEAPTGWLHIWVSAEGDVTCCYKPAANYSPRILEKLTGRSLTLWSNPNLTKISQGFSYIVEEIHSAYNISAEGRKAAAELVFTGKIGTNPPAPLRSLKVRIQLSDMPGGEEWGGLDTRYTGWGILEWVWLEYHILGNVLYLNV